MIGFIGLTLLMDRAQNWTHTVFLGAGLVYLIAIVFVACWSGLLAALADVGVLVAYVWVIFNTTWSHIPRTNKAATAGGTMLSTAITFGIFALLAAFVMDRLRKSAMREFDARAAAEAESQQRKQTEAELGASEEMRKLIVSSSLDAVIGVTAEGRITMWNGHAEELFGWAQHEAIGRSLADTVLPSEIRDFIQETSGAVLRKPVELTVKTKEGAETDIELYMAEHRAGSEPVYILFARDISERKAAERAVKELNSRLEERVAERTSQLEAANDELVGFTYSISHDLRAPLRAIVANSRILREDNLARLDEESGTRLERLESSALHLAQLIDNLLQFARIGQVALRVDEVDLSGLAEDIVGDLQLSRAGRANIAPGMRVRGDRELLKMALHNVIENAWKYTPENKAPEVEIGSSGPGEFYVRDSGIGFDMRYVDKIWEPFERLHRNNDYPGTGIGLANCKRIINRHGGHIWAESAPGEGTTMHFRLGTPSALISELQQREPAAALR